MPAARLIVWDDAACWRVHEATLALLEETGVEVRNVGAREQLAEAGARLEGTRARIPAALVDAALQSSYETIVLGDELVGYARALLVEVGVDDEALALNEIDAVGPGGSHLGRGYTRRHHRETWAPRLFDRATHDRWAAAGATTLKERVAARTQELRDEPRSFALEKSIRDRLQAVLAEAEGSSR